ncbi:hypothetical protein MRX96_053040 [Rhipicephalus microplus]
MDQPRRNRSWRNDTDTSATSLTSSETSLSEDTRQIASNLKLLRPNQDPRAHRVTGIAWHHQPIYGAAPLPASPREAALRRPPAFPRLTRSSPKKGSRSPKCSGDDPDAPQVPLTTSLCYAAIVLLTTVLALTVGLVLVRLVPDTDGQSRSSNVVQGSKAHTGSMLHLLAKFVMNNRFIAG